MSSLYRNRGVDRHRHQLGGRFLWAAHQEAPASALEQTQSIRRQSIGVASSSPPALPPLAKGDEAMKTSHAYARGGDMLLGTCNYLDLTSKGRNESGPMS